MAIGQRECVPSTAYQLTAWPSPDAPACFLTLSLLVARVAADHINRALTANDFAVLTNALNTGADFHGGLAYCFPACFGESM